MMVLARLMNRASVSTPFPRRGPAVSSASAGERYVILPQECREEPGKSGRRGRVGWVGGTIVFHNTGAFPRGALSPPPAFARGFSRESAAERRNDETTPPRLACRGGLRVTSRFWPLQQRLGLLAQGLPAFLVLRPGVFRLLDLF